ncbi:MAG TPA: TetR/AcrR family transcriptional regulator [Actinocrinis sp.]
MREATAATVTDSFTTTLPTTAIPTPAAPEGIGRLLGLTGSQPQPQPQNPRNAQRMPPRQSYPQPQAQPHPHHAVPVPRDQPGDPSRTRPDQQPAAAQPSAASAPATAATAKARRTLTRADWIATALDALARDGLRAVAVEPLAERLGATKGSFYWHFRDRNALLEAAVAHWERTATDDRLKQFDAISDPRARHYALLADLTGLDDFDHTAAPAESAAGSGSAAPTDDPRRSTQIFMVLLWNADHPVIGPVVNRVLAKRMAYSLRCRQEAGEDPQQAHQAMLSAYSVILGLNLLRRAAPGLLPGDGAPREVQDYVRGLIREATCGSVPKAA